jgi:hypothetical protein
LGRGQRPRARRKKRKDNKGLDAVFFLPNTVYPHKQEYIQHQAGQDVSHTRDITWVVVSCFVLFKYAILAAHIHDPTAKKARAGVASGGWVYNRIKCCK